MIMYVIVFLFMMMMSLFNFMMFYYFMKLMLYVVVEVNFLMLSYVDMSMYFYFDWMSMIFMCVVYLISSLVIFYSYDYMSTDKNYSLFLFLMVMFVLSMNVLVYSPSMVMMMLGWDGLGFVSYCLVIFYKNESSSSAGMLTIMTNRLGDSGLIMVIIMLAGSGVLNFNEIKGLFLDLLLVGVLVVLGAFSKSAQIPFSAWLPAAMAAPTPVSTLVHSSTLVTAGVYLVIRLNFFFGYNVMSDVMMELSIMTMFMSGTGAFLEIDLKKIIALSTLSQLSVMMLVISVGKEDLALFHLVSHALFKSMLFMCAGVIIHFSLNYQDIRELGGLWSVSPYLSMMMILGSFSLFGLPFLSGFYSKDLVLEMVYMQNNSIIMLMMLMFATVMSVAYSLRMVYYLVLGHKSLILTKNFFSIFMMIPILVMGVVVIFFGAWMMWVSFVSLNMIYLVKWVKIINLLMVVATILYFFMMKNYFFKKNYFLIKNYFIELFFLKTLSSEVIFNYINFSKIMMIDSEVWLEDNFVFVPQEEVESLMLKIIKQKILGMLVWVFMSGLVILIIFM